MESSSGGGGGGGGRVTTTRRLLTMTSALAAMALFAVTAAIAPADIRMSSSTYCSASAPLKSKYVAVFHEIHRKVRGCASESRAPAGQEVHLVLLDTSARDVLLAVADNCAESSGVVLILHSKNPVRWRLTFTRNAYPSDFDLSGGLPSHYKNYTRHVFTSPGSEVFSSNALIDESAVLDADDSKVDDSDHVESAVSRWKGLSTFSKIDGANRISIFYPPGGHLPKSCAIAGNGGGHEESGQEEPADGGGTAVVLAYKVTKQKTGGCFHAKSAGTGLSDVYIVDLDAADHRNFSAVSSSNREENEEDVIMLPPVFLSMAPEENGDAKYYEYSTEDSPPMHRNITLFLLSGQRVRWYLESKDIAGFLKVFSSNGPVEGNGLDERQQLEVVRKSLPFDAAKPSSNSFEHIWKAVLMETGGVNPMSYSKISLANVLSLIMPVSMSNSFDGFNSPLDNLSDDKARLLPDVSFEQGSQKKVIVAPGKLFKTNGKQNLLRQDINHAEARLKGALKKKCNQQETVVYLPILVADEYRVVGMTLNEPQCVGQRVGPEWVLKTQSTSCGSINSFNRKPMLSNNIHLTFEPGSKFDGLDVQVPFSCAYEAGLFGGSFGNDQLGGSHPSSVSTGLNGGDLKKDDLDYEDVDGDQDIRGLSMYKMAISLQETADNSSTTIWKQLLPAKDAAAADSAESGARRVVKLGDRVRVTTTFDTSVPVLLSLERCWISEKAAPETVAVEDEGWLIWQGCPPSENLNRVTMLPWPRRPSSSGQDDVNRSVASNPSFDFSITERHLGMEEMYVFCLIGLCSPLQSLTSEGNIVLCEDASVRCGSEEGHRSPVAIQMTRQGPVKIARNTELYRQHRLGEVVVEDFPQVVSDYQESVRLSSSGSSPSSSSSSSLPTQARAPSREPPSLRSSHVVMVGVPAEIAVAIAIGSFLVGAALMGVFCCLYQRRQRLPKSLENGEVLNASTEASELQSMLAATTVASPSVSRRPPFPLCQTTHLPHDDDDTVATRI